MRDFSCDMRLPTLYLPYLHRSLTAATPLAHSCYIYSKSKKAAYWPSLLELGQAVSSQHVGSGAIKWLGGKH